MGQYEKSLTNRTARPRSERLREIGGLIVPASAAAAGGYSIGGPDHVHWNLSDLNKLSVQGDYLYLSRDVVDPDSGDISRELVKVSAGYADRALSNADGNELNWFIPETVDGVLTLKLNPVYAGLWAEGWIADGGVGTGGGGGGGGSTTLGGLNDVTLSSPAAGDILTYDSSAGQWVNTRKATFLSGYATATDLSTGLAGKQNIIDADHKLDYSLISGAPSIPSAPGTLVTNNTTAQTASSGESLSGTINLHKIAKTGNYGDLIDRPTNVSSFNNDAGYLTSFTETDPTVPSWAKASSKPSYSLNEISGTDDLQLIEALTGGGLLRRNGTNNTWSLDSTEYLPFVGWLGGSDNLNNCTFGSWVYSSSPANYPGSVGGGQLLALGTDSSGYGKAQMAIGTTGIPFFRIRWENTWGAWREALVSGVDQTISGAKTFSNDMTLGGTLTLSGSTKKIAFGSFYIELQDLGSGNYALHTNAPFYSDQWIADGGIGSGSGGGGGLITLVKSINDLGTAIATESLTETFSAKAIESIYEAVQGKQPLIDASHKLSYNLLTDTPTIPTVPTNVSAFTNDAGYLTGNQTITLSGDVSGSGTTSIAVSIGSGKVTNAMLAGSIENSKLNTIGVTKGGTGLTSINKGAILYASASNTIAALSANGASTKKYLTQTSDNAPAWGTIAFGDLPNLYIGTTSVQQSSTAQALTGISSIKLSTSASLFEWDNDKGAWHFYGNIYSDGWIADGGIGSGSSGGMDIARMWQSLTNNPADQGYENTKIALAHIPDITVSKVSDIETWISGKGYLTSSSLSGYATETWVGQQGYITGGYIGKTALQASSASQDLTGIKQVVFESTSSPSNNSLSFAQDGLYNRPRWTYRDTSTMPASSVSKFLAYQDEIPTSLKNPYKLSFKNAGGTTTVQYDGSEAMVVTAADLGALTSHQSLANYVTLDGTQTINGAKTFASNHVTLSGVNLIPATDSTCNVGVAGANGKRFVNGAFRNIYTSLFHFVDGDHPENTQGKLSFGFITDNGNNIGYGAFTVRTPGTQSVAAEDYTFKFQTNVGFFLDKGSDNSVTVKLGTSDHRWSTIYGINGNFSGDLKLSGTTKKIYFGDTYYIELVDLGSGNTPRYALHTNAPLYSDSWIADGGIQQTS